MPKPPSFGPWDYNKPSWDMYIPDGGWWMWSTNIRDNGNTAPDDYLSRFFANFDYTDTSKPVEIMIAADDGCFVFLNGEFVGAAVAGFRGRGPNKLPLSPKQGTNTLALRCGQWYGAAGVLLSVRVGDNWVLRSDSINWHYDTTREKDM